MKKTISDKLKQFKKDPLSLVLFILVMLAIVVTLVVLVFIVAYILINGLPHLSLSLFEFEYTSENVSMMPFIINTLYLIGFALLLAVPFGIGSAIFLVEYASRQNKFVKYIRLTTETLSGIPSIVYGIFGALFFGTVFGISYSLLSGALTIAIMILPLIIRATEEALKAVPDTYREASFGVGAGKLRTVFVIVLPSAMPGILAGIILSIGRIVGETAALIFTLGTASNLIGDFIGSGRTLSVHMYILSNESLHVNESYATAVVLLIIVFIMNAISGLVAKKLQKK